MQYIGPATGSLIPTSVSNDTLIYQFTNLNELQVNSLDFLVMTDSVASIGSEICITAIITPSVPDVNPSDDTLIKCTVVGNSFDPNHKDVSPVDSVQPGEWLTYTINFQNIGTDTAFTVVVRDTLSPYVDASSFQYLGSSSKAVIQLFGNACVFTFPKINLPDSAVNPTGSQGWIQYKVKSRNNLHANTQIANTAYIYFDYNSPVVTNTTVNLVNSISGITSVSGSGTIHLYPNPNRGSFTLATSGSIGSDYTISDMLGHVIIHSSITSDSQTIYLPEASEGVYTLVVKGAQPIRFVIVR